jgi:N-acetylneuraminate epimerase
MPVKRPCNHQAWNSRTLLGRTIGILLVLSRCSAQSATALEFSKLPALPNHEGFAGAFAGVANGSLIVAGGANFPDKKPWEGGKKVWYDSVFALEKPDATWKVVGRLPRPLGYGVSVTTAEGFVCIGGSDAEQHHAEVFLLTLQNGRLETRDLPRLPVPLANPAGALLGDTILVFGGAERPGEQSALNRLFAFDLKAARPRWRELEPCPGKPRILPVAAVVNGAFHIAGGASLEQTNGNAARVYLRDAWRYRPGAGWKRLADLPKPSVAAPSPAPVAGSEFFILGGDDGSLAEFKPVEKHPGFPDAILAYDTRTDAWHPAGRAPAARATLPTAFWQNRWVLVSGEVRPGVRSPEVWALEAIDRP